MNQQPIFILGAHKSGTTMLRNLLSGHSQLFVVPFESHFFQLDDRNVEYEYRKTTSQGLSTKEVESKFKQWIKTQNEAVDPMGDTFVTGKLNTILFNASFSLDAKDSANTKFEKYIGSIHESLGLGALNEDKRVVEKSVENAEFAQELARMYPQAKFVHIVRNPYANFVSLRKYKSVGFGYPLLKRMARTFQNSYKYLIENPKQIAQYKVLRYEDILSDSQTVMSDLAAFLEIPFEDVLLTPSHLGEIWSGNSTSGKGFKGLSDANLDKWKESIHPVESKLVNTVGKDVLNLYNYPKYKSEGNWLSRCEGESLARYAFNRLAVRKWV